MFTNNSVFFSSLLQMKHYKFETYEESDLERNGSLLTLKANIQPWEFVQFLSTGTIQKEIQPGQVSYQIATVKTLTLTDCLTD